MFSEYGPWLSCQYSTHVTYIDICTCNDNWTCDRRLNGILLHEGSDAENVGK